MHKQECGGGGVFGGSGGGGMLILGREMWNDMQQRSTHSLM